MALDAFCDPILKRNLKAELVDGVIISREAELGDDVTVERGAVILVKTKILRGMVEMGAVVVDCVAQTMQAGADSKEE